MSGLRAALREPLGSALRNWEPNSAGVIVPPWTGATFATGGAETSSAITLSNGNRTATRNNSVASGNSRVASSRIDLQLGKIVEFTIGAVDAGNVSVGGLPPFVDGVNTAPGNTPNSMGWFLGTALIFYNSEGWAGTGGVTAGAGDRIAIGYNYDTYFWFKNGAYVIGVAAAGGVRAAISFFTIGASATITYDFGPQYLAYGAFTQQV
jgi:hypothetical protein